jgi:serine/threonine protein phosphatase PrpC
MEINKYIKPIDIAASNEEQIQLFLAQKESNIREFIINAWNEYIQAHTLQPEIPTLSISNESEVSLNKTVENGFQSTQTPLNSNETKMDENKIATPNDGSGDKAVYEAFALQLKNKTISLPNGKVNQVYKVAFTFEQFDFKDINDFWFEGIEKIGLKFQSDTCEITGTPILAGEHKIKLCIKRNDWTEGKPIFEREITLVINHDPKSLWKDIPTPLETEYYKPDNDKQFIKVEASSGFLGIGREFRKDIVAASQRGRSHAHEGKARDDDFGLSYDKISKWYIMSVADGAGSAKSSRKGSEIVCKTFVDVCQMQLTSQHENFEHLIKEFSKDTSDAKRKLLGDALYGIIGTAVFKAYKAIEEEAQKTSKPIKDFSTTLIVSICKKFKFGWFVGAFWVGDGAIGIYNKQTQFLKVLGESDGGEFAGQTRFLTMPEITQPAELYHRLRFDIVQDFTALILMTDGISDPKFETDANLLKIEKWNNLWTDLSTTVKFTDDNEFAADQLLQWLDFWSPGNHDDRTIAILY